MFQARGTPELPSNVPGLRISELPNLSCCLLGVSSALWVQTYPKKWYPYSADGGAWFKLITLEGLRGVAIASLELLQLLQLREC